MSARCYTRQRNGEARERSAGTTGAIAATNRERSIVNSRAPRLVRPLRRRSSMTGPHGTSSMSGFPARRTATPHGCHFCTDKIWERHRRHGSLDISSLVEMPADLLTAISDGTITNSDCAKWAFLDTETTGLAGGSGTYAFLIGVGRITPAGFELRQFFMRDLAEEASLLHGLSEYLSQFETLVTYNGKTYDQPLLETRYRMARMKPPFSRMEHLDLLFGARRLWKLRFDSCRLVDLENQILGFEREGDLPGEMIPYVYFEYLRKREASRIVPILHHNAIDILTLACLTAIVPRAFQSPEDAPLTHGAEMVGLARWLCRCEQYDKALHVVSPRSGQGSARRVDVPHHVGCRPHREEAWPRRCVSGVVLGTGQRTQSLPSDGPRGTRQVL